MSEPLPPTCDPRCGRSSSGSSYAGVTPCAGGGKPSLRSFYPLIAELLLQAQLLSQGEELVVVRLAAD